MPILLMLLCSWRTLEKEATAAIGAKDWAKLRTVLRAQQPLLPGNTRIAYNLAATSALLGDVAGALQALGELVDMGLVLPIEADDDFVALHARPEFSKLLTRMQLNAAPVTHAKPAFEIAERDVIPEDLAYDPQTKRFFISSVREKKIFLGDGKTFAEADLSVLALGVDAKRRRLWATVGALPPCQRCDKAGKTALLAYDLDGGKLLERLEAPVTGVLGDLTVSEQGDVYACDGLRGAVLRLAVGTTGFTRLDTPGELPSPQTPALSADGATLFVPDYVRGIAVINVTTKAMTMAAATRGVALSGIDGLYRRRDGFIAVQNGTSPPRLIWLSPTFDKFRVLEANWNGLGEPTHGTFVGDAFYFIANSGWNAYDGEGKRNRVPPVFSRVMVGTY